MCRLFGLCGSVSCERRRLSCNTRSSAPSASRYFTLLKEYTSQVPPQKNSLMSKTMYVHGFLRKTRVRTFLGPENRCTYTVFFYKNFPPYTVLKTETKRA